jgi:phage shock protein E
MSHRMRLALAASLALTGALACSSDHPAPVQGDVAAAEVLELVGQSDGPILLDVRTAPEFEGGHVPGAVNIPHSELGGRLAEVDAWRERGAVVYCERGGRAGVAADVLADAGFDRVLHLEGDMSGWREAGREVER